MIKKISDTLQPTPSLGSSSPALEAAPGPYLRGGGGRERENPKPPATGKGGKDHNLNFNDSTNMLSRLKIHY